jgi:hypothetical protein
VGEGQYAIDCPPTLDSFQHVARETQHTNTFCAQMLSDGWGQSARVHLVLDATPAELLGLSDDSVDLTDIPGYVGSVLLGPAEGMSGTGDISCQAFDVTIAVGQRVNFVRTCPDPGCNPSTGQCPGGRICGLPSFDVWLE